MDTLKYVNKIIAALPPVDPELEKLVDELMAEQHPDDAEPLTKTTDPTPERAK